MSIAEHNFCVVENDLLAFGVTLRDKASQAAIDLTGAVIKMQVRTSFTAAAISLDFTIGDGITVSAPTSGKADFSKLVAIADGDYVYDLQYNFSDTGPQTRLRGKFKVLPEVTQDA